jgi:D-alanyl-D-alanine carboxypeptidase
MGLFRLAACVLAASATACAGSSPTASSVRPFASGPPAPSTTVSFAVSDAGTRSSDLETEASAGAASNVSVEMSDASAPPLAETSPATASGCNEQGPQDFLVRSNFRKAGPEALERAIQYRTETYGYFKGFGHASRDAQPPSAQVVATTFMDLPVRMHRKVVPALKCVEEEVKRACADHRYTPHALAGIRFRNTYRGGEVTNHIYGIAIDIDPDTNSCCGCVKPWNEAPACKRPAKTEYDRMAMPECWVHAFERFGFYWLGHDVLRDTMHFEFLGDPARIVKE